MSIVPSRLSCALHILMASAVAGTALWLSPLWLVGALLIALLGVLHHTHNSQPRGTLRCTLSETGAARWEWRGAEGADWHTVQVRCDYLGPLLIGLRLDDRRIWLWPDSSDGPALRQLRRQLVQQPRR